MKFLGFLLIVGGFIQLIQVVLEVHHSPVDTKDLAIGAISVAQVLLGLVLSDYARYKSKSNKL